MEVAGRHYFLRSQLRKWTADWLPVVPIKKIPPTRLTMNKKEVILPVFQIRVLFNCSHETFSVIKAVAPNVFSLTRGHPNCANQSEGAACVRQPAQFARWDEGANIMPGHGHNLHRR